MSNATTNSTATTSASATVVSNDTLDSYEDTRQIITLLTTKREQWESTELRKSNDALYEILTQCYELYEHMRSGTTDAVQCKKALFAVCDENGYTFLSSTPLITKIVKCVFGVERRRVSAYSIVLREAMKQKVSPANLAQWIADMGGVEQARLSKAPNAKTAKQKAKLGKQAIEQTKVLATAKSTSLSKALNTDKAGEQCVLLAVQNADGSFSINAVIESVGATNAALAAYYSQNKEAIETSSKQQQITEKVVARDESIEQALAA